MSRKQGSTIRTLRERSRTDQLVCALCTHIERLFLLFGGPVCADRISNCPLERVLTYKNLIYLLNLQITHLDIWTDSQVTHHVVATEKVAELHILTKCSKCNTFQVISDLGHDFRNFNTLKIASEMLVPHSLGK